MSQDYSGSQEDTRRNQSSFGNTGLASRIDLEPYVGRWVAIAGDRVAGVGETALSAEHMGRRNRVRERLAVYFVEPLDGAPFPFSDIFEKIRPILTGMDVPIYLVGGAVRDGLLGKTSHDLDFVVPHGGIETAYKVANRLGYPAYVLDGERDAGRVVLEEPDITLDFTSFRGSDLEADLRARDFTINAMALPVPARSKSSLIDPLDGYSDLNDHRIRLCHPDAIHHDPVRCLRAIRMLIETGFQPTLATITAVTKTAPQLTNVSEERIRDELLKLFATNQPAIALDYLVKWQIFTTILPEFDLPAGVDHAEAGTYPKLRRTKLVLEYLVSLRQLILNDQTMLQIPMAKDATWIEQARLELLPYRLALASHFNRQFAGGLEGWLVMRLAALLHELSNAGAESQDPQEPGRVSRENLDLVKLTGTVLRRYRFSNEVRQHINQAIRSYELLLRLVETKRVDRRTAYRYFKAVPDAGLDLCLLSLARTLALNDDHNKASGWTEMLNATSQLLEYYFNQYETTIRPAPLVNGNDLIKRFSLMPGPEIGRLLQLIEEAQAVGEVQSRSEALELAHRLLSTN